MSDAVLVDRPRPEVAVVTMHRPDRLNAMNADLVEGLHQAFAALAADPACRLVVLTGAGRGFCAGVDLGGYGPVPGAEHRRGPGRAALAVQRHIASLVPRMRSMPQPIIAAVNGPAAGGGLALTLASDIRMASSAASFAVAFVRVGISACDIGTSWLLPRLVGAARAHELMLTGRPFDAEEAAAMGLILPPVAPDRLLGAAMDEAALVLANSPWAVEMTKETMWASMEVPGLEAAIALENRTQVLSLAVGDHEEAARAFIEKRPPRWQAEAGGA